jgi:adenosylmethionine-8-amino-7-oxononanoate aminotransferase
MCLSKGLTGGFLPLAAVLATQAIYDGFLDDLARTRVPAFAQLTPAIRSRARPRCGAGDLRRRRRAGAQRATAARMTELAALGRRIAARGRCAPGGDDPCFELTQNGGQGHTVRRRITRRAACVSQALELGVVLRPLGDILYWMPPYCIDDDQLDLLARHHARRHLPRHEGRRLMRTTRGIRRHAR